MATRRAPRRAERCVEAETFLTPGKFFVREFSRCAPVSYGEFPDFVKSAIGFLDGVYRVERIVTIEVDRRCSARGADSIRGTKR